MGVVVDVGVKVGVDVGVDVGVEVEVLVGVAVAVGVAVVATPTQENPDTGALSVVLAVESTWVESICPTADIV